MTQSMILHWSPRSPYVRKVIIEISEIGLQDAGADGSVPSRVAPPLTGNWSKT